MKIDKAIVSSDDNRFYLDFWEPVSRVWKEKFNITPVLLYVSDSDFEPSTKYGEVVRYRPQKGCPIYLQTLWVRYYHPIREPDTVWAISDIDMFPVSREYFVDRIKNIEDDKYVHLDPSIEEYKKFPSCYHIAKGRTFEEILDLPDEWDQSLWLVDSSNLGSDPGAHLVGKKDWFADERFATNKIVQKMNLGDKRIVLIQREGGRCGHRLDRINFFYDATREAALKSGYYYDFHSPRPYLENKSVVDRVVKDIMELRC